MHTLDFESNFTELSFLEGRKFRASDGSAKRVRFSLQGEIFGGWVELHPVRFCPPPILPGKYFNQLFSLIWNWRDTLLAFAGKKEHTPDRDYGTQGFGVSVYQIKTHSSSASNGGGGGGVHRPREEWNKNDNEKKIGKNYWTCPVSCPLKAFSKVTWV